MNENVASTLPAGTFRLEFGGMELHAIATEVIDTRPQRVAVHEFDRRPGAQNEPMGRGPHSTRTTLVWVGEDGFKDALRFGAMLDENPTRLLVHPIYGRMQATCKGFDGATLRAAEPNTYRTPVEFSESNLDGRIVAPAAQGVPAKAGAVTDGVETLQAFMSDLSITIGTGVQAFLDAASSFATLALDAASAATLDPSLSSALAAFLSLTGTAQLELRAIDTPEASQAADQCEVIAADARDLGAAVLATKPAPTTWIVPGDMTPLAILGRVYGAAAGQHLDALYINNPGIVGLDPIPAGTRLLLEAA